MFLLLPVGLFCVYMDQRLKRAGDWLPTMPESFGVWTSTPQKIKEDELAILGHPKYVMRDYTSAFGEHVSMTVVAANSVDAYHDPRVCSVGSGFDVTAERGVELAGKGSTVRAMILKRGDYRVLMYYWLQNSDGTVETEGSMSRDLTARIQCYRFVFNTVAAGRETCLVRVSALIPPSDTQGVQTRRNVTELSRAIYTSLKKG